MNLEINYLSILLASVAFMAIGFLWYSPLVLGRQWMKEKGYTKESLQKAQKEMGKLYGMSFVASLLTAFVLAHVMGLSHNFYNYAPLSTGINSAFWMWIGFVMPTQLTATIFSDKKNFRLFGIDTGYQLVGMLTMAVVIALMM